MCCHAGLHVKAPGLVRRQKERGESIGKALWFSREGIGRAVSSRGLKLDSLGVVVVSSYPLPGPGVI